MKKLNGYILTEDDLKFIRKDCLEYLADNNGLNQDPDDSNNWVECIIGGGSIVVDCHLWTNTIINHEYKIVIDIYDTYVDPDDDHRITDTASDHVSIDLFDSNDAYAEYKGWNDEPDDSDADAQWLENAYGPNA